MSGITVHVQADTQTVFKQAPDAASEYLRHAIREIDDQLGKGYAKQHPELICIFMQTAAKDLDTAVIARAIETLATAVEEAASIIGGAIVDAHE